MSNPYIGLYHTHKTVVVLFLLIYLIKTILIFVNQDALTKFTKIIKIPEMMISFGFLATGIGMLVMWPEVRMLQVIKLVVVFISIPVAIIGFKKQNKPLALLSLVLIIGAYGLAEVNKRKFKVEKPQYEARATLSILGKQLYNGNCIICHGADGKLGQAGAKNLAISKLQKNEIIEIVTHGKNSMPPYKKYFDEKEIEAVADYVLTLRQ